MQTQSYRDLTVWQKAMDAAVIVYRISQLFPPEEKFGLTSQVRRAVTSIAANIAEGRGRLHSGDYLRFLSIARGSLMETETLIQLALRLEFIDARQSHSTLAILQEVGRLLNGLIKSIRAPGIKEGSAPYFVNNEADQDPLLTTDD